MCVTNMLQLLPLLFLRFVLPVQPFNQFKTLLLVNFKTVDTRHVVYIALLPSIMKQLDDTV